MAETPLTHLDAEGRARMVDVSPKAETARRAVAEACVHMQPETLARIVEGSMPKGDVLAVARLAGIQGAKRTSDLVPLCHPLRVTDVDVEAEAGGADHVRIRATVRAVDRTGVEMEALTAASVAALALYDMVKGVDRAAEIRAVRLLEKDGGKSGPWRRASEDA